MRLLMLVGTEFDAGVEPWTQLSVWVPPGAALHAYGVHLTPPPPGCLTQ
jgi:hypothetical protein